MHDEVVRAENHGLLSPFKRYILRISCVLGHGAYIHDAEEQGKSTRYIKVKNIDKDK